MTRLMVKLTIGKVVGANTHSYMYELGYSACMIKFSLSAYTGFMRVREMLGLLKEFNVRELSRNFMLCQGKMNFC